MTEFETQVAEALTEVVAEWRYPDGCSERRVGLWRAEELAPRVAAAIEAAARDFGQDIASAEQAALRALRGETP